MIGKLKAAEGFKEVTGVKEDYRKASRYGQYKIGELALYYPDDTYIDRKEITDIQLKAAAVEFNAAGKLYVLKADNENMAEKMEASLKYR